MDICWTNSFSVKTPPLYLSFRPPILSLLNQLPSLSLSVSNKSQTRKSITCARNKKIRSGSNRSTIILLQSAYFIASKLNIIPEPLDLAIREFSGGNNGGSGFGKGFGWGGFDGGRRRRRKTKSGLLVFLMVVSVSLSVSVLGLWLILGKQLGTEVFYGVFGLALFGLFSVYWWKVEVKDWVLGFCSCAFLVGVGLGRDNLQRWSKNFKPPEIVRRRKKRGLWLWRL